MLTPPAEIRTHPHRFSCTQSCTQGGQAALRGEIHTTHQVLEAWIRTPIVEQRVNLKEHHPIRALLVRLFQPAEGLFFLAQGSVDPAYPIRRWERSSTRLR